MERKPHITYYEIYEIYSYFQKGCRKKFTRQSRKVSWVVLSSLFERMAREAMEVCLRELKESNKSRFDSYSVRNSVLIIYAILPFRIVAYTFFPTTFLEIAVYCKRNDVKRLYICPIPEIFSQIP